MSPIIDEQEMIEGAAHGTIDTIAGGLMLQQSRRTGSHFARIEASWSK
jgi:hypothetical protein